ncbi:MAG TPA: gamma-glutamyl-gamma-aminobutyrate hydrolase family protein [Burkholderiales bacterium]|nr:gamma-glutamyl-gamma-aminobutyrate hydrolase family protein [Burkholderiales bacterium]
MNRKPLIGIPATVRTLEFGLHLHGNAQQYYDAVVNHVGATVVTIPSLPDHRNALEFLDHVDGVLLTGGTSNIHPSAYGKDVVHVEDLFDPLRDASSFAIIRECVARAIPLFGICRGAQEMNVAFGGTLHERVHEVPGKRDHRADETKPLREQFGDAHEIEIQPGGVLEQIFGRDTRAKVSSAHTQAIDRLADRLRIEALSDDGVIEAVSVKDAKAFALAVQFHPEWHADRNPLYAALFAAFAKAVRA